MRMQPSTAPSRSARPQRRTYLILALLGIVVAQIVAMAMVTRSQVRSARERESLQAASRAAAARCFESAANRAMDVCVATGTPRQGRDVVDNSASASAVVVPAPFVRNAGAVMAVGFASSR